MQLLRKIAKDGHVYGFSLNLGELVGSGGVPQPRLIGVGRASTFTGFCSKHDDQLFSEIEKEPIRVTERHAFLLTYRALSRELYAKEGGMLLEPHRRTLDRGVPIEQQAIFQNEVAAMSSGLSVGLNEIRVRKRRLDESFESSDYSGIRFYVVWFEQPPDIMCSGYTNPDWDFDGKQLQNLLDLDTPGDGIAISLVASGSAGCAFFSWLEEEDRACIALLRSLSELPESQLSHAIVRLVLGSLENQYWGPEWWEELDDATRKALLARFMSCTSPFVPIDSGYLKDDGIRAVDWPIVGRETNVAALM